MANSNPHKARTAKRRKKLTAGTVEDARGLLWQALTQVQSFLVNQSEEEPLTLNDSLRVLHALSQGASAYARIVEVGELEARLTALEEGAGSDNLRLGTGAA